jgi:hypothetical protein
MRARHDRQSASLGSDRKWHRKTIF